MISPLEIAANMTVAASIILAGRNSIHTWWLGIIACALFGVLFFQARLYADVMLQAFFVGTSVIGWWQWLHGDHGGPLVIRRTRLATLAGLALIAVAATAGYGALLHHYTDAYAPFMDSAVLVLSVIAQLLLMQRRLEAWPFWLLVNSIAVPLYASRGLYLTSVLYGVFWINAVVAFVHWRRLERETALRAGLA